MGVRVFCRSIGLAGALLTALTASALAVQVKPHWHFDGYVGSVIVGSRYAFMGSPPSVSDYGSGGTLLDEATGKRRHVDQAGCVPAGLGGGWLAFLCKSESEIRLYHISPRSWRTLPLPSGALSVWAVGQRWLQLYINKSPYQFVFENTTTGQLRTLEGFLPGDQTIPNLDSPALGQRLCSPLRIPDTWNYTGGTEGPGTVAFGNLAMCRRSAAAAAQSSICCPGSARLLCSRRADAMPDGAPEAAVLHGSDERGEPDLKDAAVGPRQTDLDSAE